MELKQLASDARYENPKLAQLQLTLLDEFRKEMPRGIIFSKTRRGTHCLYDWVNTNHELLKVNITAGILTGTGTGANHMTQVQQENISNGFPRSSKSICWSCLVEKHLVRREYRLILNLLITLSTWYTVCVCFLYLFLV